MHLVIADDLTGAAEIAGVASRYGLQAEVLFRQSADRICEFTAITTDTRAMPDEDAAREVASLAQKLNLPRDCRVFKKVDSILRGPVIAELSVLMKELGRSRSLVVPCNPSLGRTIHSGRYWISGKPIHKTDFAQDPERPAQSSGLPSLLGVRPSSIHVLPVGATLPPSGIVIGEAQKAEDIVDWAKGLDLNTLPAGAADFFTAILEHEGRTPIEASKPPDLETILMISGSASRASRDQVDTLESLGVPVLRMPDELFDDPAQGDQLVRSWADRAADLLAAKGRAIVSIGRPVEGRGPAPVFLSSLIGQLTERILARSPVEQLWIEGGATASAIVRRAGWSRFRVVCELAPGSVLLEPRGPGHRLLMLKPGSYAWPDLFGIN